MRTLLSTIISRVRLIKLNEGHKVATIAIVPKQEDEEEVLEIENVTEIPKQKEVIEE